MMRGPDYIIIGAMKCGTSTLAAQLGSQQGVFMTSPKEPNYFSDDAVFAQGPEWYAALFADADAGDVKGEASTHYTKRPELPDTVERMSKTAPDVRLIYMIRDPMARLVSHYIHAWTEGWVTAPIEDVIDTYTPLVDYGRFGWQIEPFVQKFGAEAICLTSLERLRTEKGHELARLAEHIGASGPVAWVEEGARENVSSERVRKFPLHGLLIDSAPATFLRRALIPKALRTRIRDTRKMKDRPVIPEARISDLRDVFAKDRDFLGEVFPGDPSLELAYPWLR